MTGSIVGKRLYKKVTTREADDGNGWTVMLDYRTLKTPSKRPFKLRSLALAKAIAADWEYQAMSIVLSGIHPHQNLAVVRYMEEKINAEEKAAWVNNAITKGFTGWGFCILAKEEPHT